MRTLRWIGIYLLVSCLLLTMVLCGNRTVTVIASKRFRESSHCIIIDPGHGGEDGGAISCTGEPESQYNLEIANILNDLLNLFGYKTRMIRTKDISIYSTGETLSQKKISDLKERVRITNETAGAIFISIHQNHFPDSRYNGAQVFYAHSDGSKVLADTIQASFTATINKGSKRHVKKGSGIYIMEHIQCPGALVECGFLSNPEENAKLKDPVYQRKICTIIATSLSHYLSNA